MTAADTQLRLALLSRHFWPRSGPVELSISDLADAIIRSGHQVQLLTIRWDKRWTRHFRFREMEVTRVSRSISGPWGMFRFLKRLARHVEEQNFDGLIVFGLHRESWAAIRYFAGQMPLVVHVPGHEFRKKKPFRMDKKKLAILNSLDGILVDCESTAQLLERNGIHSERIKIAPWPVLLDPQQRSHAGQAIARAALTDAHPILQINSDQPLVVYGASQFGDLGLHDLIDAWPRVLDRFPQAKLWILGDGLKARSIWERICEHGLADQIIMPGFFDSWQEILRAANVYVHPLRNSVACPGLNRALASGICCVATESQHTRDLIQPDHNGLLSPSDNPEALAEAIGCALNNIHLRNRLGNAAKQQARKIMGANHVVERFVGPFAGRTVAKPAV